MRNKLLRSFLLCLPAQLALAGGAAAVREDFESFAHDTELYEQVAGVRFTTTPWVTQVASGASSGSRVLSNREPGAEFNPAPLVMEFTAPQSRVEVQAGVIAPATAGIPATLRALSAGGTVIDSDSTTIPAGNTSISQTLVVEAASPSIVRVELEYLAAFPEVIDDLDFVPGGPPTSPDVTPPVVTILTPSNGAAFDTDSFLFEATILEDGPLKRLTIDIRTTGGSAPFELSYGGSAPNLSVGPTHVHSLGYGLNVVTLTAEDFGGNTGRDTVRITRRAFEPTAAWPLCGDLWKTALPPDVCPPGRRGPAFADDMRIPYGPRRKPDYDWHRGIDIYTEDSSHDDLAARRSVFAIADARVIQCKKKHPSGQSLIACTDPQNIDPDFPDYRLTLEHERPDHDPARRCYPNGCYYSRYVHLSSIHDGAFLDPPADGVPVCEGALLGKTGHATLASAPPGHNYHNHLHFEIRSAIDRQTDIMQREAINPLVVLPYPDSPTAACADSPGERCDPEIEVELAVPSGTGDSTWSQAVDLSNPELPDVTVKARLDSGLAELDLDHIEVRVSALEPSPLGGSALVPIPQGSVQTLPTTPEKKQWLLTPPYFDMHLLNRQYTYKHEVNDDYVEYPFAAQEQVTYDAFQSGAEYASPFAQAPSSIPSSWNPLVPDHHLTATVAGTEVGEFNGMRIWPARFTSSSSEQTIYVRFQALQGATDPLCIEAVAYDIRGQRSAAPATAGPCAPPAPATVQVQWTGRQAEVLIEPVPTASFYRVWQSRPKSGSMGPARDVLVHQGSRPRIRLPRADPESGLAVEACYASAPRCALGGGICSTAQCSPLTPAR